MATFNHLLGHYSGKIGPYIAASWKGIPYLRSQPTRRDPDKMSPAQRVQQRKFILATSFAKTIGPLLTLSFRPYAVRMTGRNGAISWILKNAIASTENNLTLNYANILISRGDLPGALEASVLPAAAGHIQFQWKPNGGNGSACNSDKALVVVHCPELDASVYHTAAADRSKGMAAIDAARFAGKTVHTWIGFISENGLEVANSVYT